VRRYPKVSSVTLLRPFQDRDSSLGVVNDRPSVDIGAQRPLLVASWLVRADCSIRLPEGVRIARYSEMTFGLEMPHSRLVPSLSFLPTSTVFSAEHVAGFLRPAADHGVRRVSRPALSRFAFRSQGASRMPGCLVLFRGLGNRRYVGVAFSISEEVRRSDTL
jgi:hypothetical protein